MNSLKKVVSLLMVSTLMPETQGLQMMLKNQDWYCMSVQADRTT